MHFEGVEPRSSDFNRRYCFNLKGQVGKATVHGALGQKEKKVPEVKEKLSSVYRLILHHEVAETKYLYFTCFSQTFSKINPISTASNSRKNMLA